MKKILLSVTVLFAAATAYGQNLMQSSSVSISSQPVTNFAKDKASKFRSTNVVTCGNDTILYPLAKASSAQFFKMVGNGGGTRAEGMGQYYDAPQPITVKGFQFYGRGEDGNVTVSASLYSASPVDSTPLVQLATQSVVLNQTAPSLGVMERTVMFTAPITVTGPYLLVVEGSPASIDTFHLVTNGNGNGRNERLAQVRVLGTTWLDAQSAFGVSFDLLAHPIVTYNLSSTFTATDSACVGDAVTFTSTSSPILDNRMYNTLVFDTLQSRIHSWEFNDGSPIARGATTTHTFTAPGTYTVELEDTLIGWTNSCLSDTAATIVIGDEPMSMFTMSDDTIDVSETVTITNNSTGAVSCMVDFGDGTTASSCANQSHTYAVAGTYIIKLITTNTCGSDTLIDTLQVVSGVGIATFTGRNVTVTPNPAKEFITIDMNTSPGQSEAGIYAINGSLVKKLQLNNVSKLTVNTSDLEAGIYLLKITSEKGQVVKRIEILK